VFCLLCFSVLVLHFPCVVFVVFDALFVTILFFFVLAAARF